MEAFHRVIDHYEDLVSSIESLDLTERYDLLHLEARIVLIDGSELHVSEVWKGEDLEKYSYYWLEESGETIVGWDNAPHHDVETFPHHRHEGGEVEPSEPMDAETVLRELQDRIL
ncbi:MAG: DUF6516 family protein [Candidatus Nanohaloarchaeota archaeon QJJ-7]|nr:DUF6516 family protein [Candidatus Nanohaloarchaeota archaeon QJJ-7]